MEELRNFIKSQIDISDHEMQTTLSRFKERIIQKNRFLIKKGQIAAFDDDVSSPENSTVLN